MSLVIIIQANHLCGEFRNLIESCLNLKPKYLIVNSLNHDLIDYYVINYGHHHLTCFPFRILEDLCVQIEPSYRGDRYLCLNTLDPITNRKFLQRIIQEFDESGQKYGYLTSPISRENLVSHTKLRHTVSQVSDCFFYYNHATENSDCYYLSNRHNFQTYQPKLKLVNKTVMITGALGGIGLATARYYVNQGWQVIGLDLKNPKDLDREAQQIFTNYFQLDLSRTRLSDQIRRILKRIRSLDVLVHIAGIQSGHSIRGTHSTGKTWNRIFNVNVRSIYTLTRLCFNHLRKTLGSVVVISSVHAIASSDKISIYAITKSALSGLVRNFALEWGKYGIRVNAVAPGAVDTAMLRDGLSRRGDPERVLQRLKKRHLMGKVGQPDQIARSIYFLGDSEKSGFMTGQTMVVDGGASIRLSTEVS